MTDAINSHSRRMYNAQKKTRADLATPAPAVKVKALVWTHGGIESHATTAFGDYLIANCHEEGFGLWGVGADIEDEPNLGYFDAPEAAQAAAQAHHDAMILAELEPATPPEDPRVKALVKKARAVVDRWDSPLWKELPHTGESIADLRAALEAIASPSLSALEENK
jgi:hypothetical protein